MISTTMRQIELIVTLLRYKIFTKEDFRAIISDFIGSDFCNTVICV